MERRLLTLLDHLTGALVEAHWHLKAYSRNGPGETKLGKRAGTRTLIWVDSRLWGKVGAETEGKIKTGARAGELRPPLCLRVLLHIYNEKGRRGGLVFAPQHTLD